MGLSMGGTLAIRLAEEHGDEIAGLVLVNPSLLTKRPDRFLLPFLQRVKGTWAPIASDIKKDGPVELAYDQLPVKAAYQLSSSGSSTRADLGKVTQPLLVCRSTEDHVVEPDSCRDAAGQGLVDRRPRGRCWRTATTWRPSTTTRRLIFESSLEFVRRLARAVP